HETLSRQHLREDEQHEQRGQGDLDEQYPQLFAGDEDVPPEDREERLARTRPGAAQREGEVGHRRPLPVSSMKTSSRLGCPMWTSVSSAERVASRDTTGPSIAAASVVR